MINQIQKHRPQPQLFSLENHPMTKSICSGLNAKEGSVSVRQFPDGETYLRIRTDVMNLPCIIIADLSAPNAKFLPLIFLADTLKEMGATSVGLVAPYLSYMRQDKRFEDGEAVTSRTFAQLLSQHIDWLVTVGPHLHRYHSLDEIYSVPSYAVQGAPALTDWLKDKKDLLLVGPDAESEQWVSEIAHLSSHPYVIGEKTRFGDRNVEINFPDLNKFKSKTAVIIDDVISSGHTILQCINTLNKQGITHISCAAIHGIFANDCDVTLLKAGLSELVTSNTIKHSSNTIDVAPLLIQPIIESLKKAR